MTTTEINTVRQRRLIRLISLSIAAACTTITLKITAWLLTGSVGLLSDAAESVVNLFAALFAFAALQWAARPPDEEHAWGHEKADYLAAGVEGGLILIAAVTICISAIDRLIHPQAISQVGLGLAVSLVATLINFAVARRLIGAGREERSATLKADGRHLMTDVWTSLGVVAAVGAVALTGWQRLDPIIALVVAVNVVVTGVALVRSSTGGLMDRALSPDEINDIDAVLDAHRSDQIQFHALRTRRAGYRAFVSLHVLVPGAWSVQHGHDLIEQIESDLRGALDSATILTHLEPIEDPASFRDTDLDRPDDA
jgi:cation diffusion facilitator family transporter